MSHLPLAFRIIHLGITNIRAHAMRSVLTVLGIVFGVCSVIIMLAIGEGASKDAQDQIRRLGSQNIIIQSKKPVQSPDAGSASSGSFVLTYGITYRDAEKLAALLPAVDVAIPVKGHEEDIRFGSRKVQATVLGTVPWINRSSPVTMIRGQFITENHMAHFANVCVISDTIAQKLFLHRDPMNEGVRIGADTYRVVGIMGSGDRVVEAGQELDSQTGEIYIPLTTSRARKGDMTVRQVQGSRSAEQVELSELILAVDTPEEVLPTADRVERYMREAHPKQDYRVIVPQRLIEQARATQRRWSIMLGSVAAISLVVGGIGIMNIMLASVSERTREIGVRRALGARRRDIMSQFLVECLILSIGGGVIGIILGAIIPPFITWKWGFNTVLTAGPFIISFGVSAMVGLIFGLYPARRAAMMDPIDALRHE